MKADALVGIPDLINGRMLEEERYTLAVVGTSARLGKLCDCKKMVS